MTRDPADVIEDLEFLNETGIGALEAVQRADFPSSEAMERWLYRNDRPDLWLAMKARDPKGAHEHKTTRRLREVDTETVDPIATLLAEARRSDRKRVRGKGERISALVEELRESLSIEREDAEAREKARRDIERLERQLADAKARLKGGSAQVAVGDGISAAEIREWARRNGVECPPMGRVPSVVRDAYEAEREAS